MQLPVSIFSLLFFAGLASAPVKKAPVADEKLPWLHVELKQGDVVLRNGKGMISDIFRNTSSSRKEYSHAGVIYISGNDTLVLHVIGDGVTSGIKKETFDSFCSPEHNTSYAVYRYDFLAGHEKEVDAYLHKRLSGNIVFDEQFDLATDSELYCSELVYKMVVSAGCKLHHSTHEGIDYVSLDDLYTNGARLILKHSYKNEN